jgi:uncharacterized RDD family membrane protein YckC
VSAYYYFSRDEQVTGPVGLDTLRALLQQRRIDEQTQLWSDGADWRPLGEALPQFNPPPPPVSTPAVASATTAAQPPPLPPPLVAQVPEYRRPPAEAPPAKGWHLEPPHPWRRYLARMIDHYSIGLLGYAVLTVPFYAMSSDIHATEAILTNSLVASIAVTLISAPLCALFIGLSGTTPGKWCAGVRVLSRQGGMIGLGAALSRELRIWVSGFGLGLPLVSLITMVISYNTLKQELRMGWDEEVDAVVQYRDASPWISARLAVAAVLLGILVAALVGVGEAERLRP